MNTENKKKHSIAITKRFLKAIDMIIAERENGRETTLSVADAVGMQQSNIARLRRASGEFSVTVEALGRICEAYKVNPTWLITGKGTVFSKDELLSAFELLEQRIAGLESAGRKALEKAEKLENQKGQASRSVNKNVNTPAKKAAKSK
ncbi:hypothetical protein JMG10_07795 [Nostoc ellipsosporum NOK]|nr:hypothetical protein [Nostoc ellipsosporum NOK]